MVLEDISKKLYQMVKIEIEKQDSVKIYKIRKILEELSKKAGRGTELITVYRLDSTKTCF